MKYGLIWDKTDYRDFQAPMPRAAITYPPVIDMRPQCPPVYDQGDGGTCTANAATGLYQFTQREQKNTSANSSRLFLYWNTRSLMGTTGEDSGASIRDTFKAMNKWGLCLESIWPYKLGRLTTKPNAKAYADGEKKRVLKYVSVPQTLQAIKAQLFANNPIVFGFEVFPYFESDEMAKAGILMRPTSGASIGGHAVVCVGYLTLNGVEYAIIRNSWGKSWGLSGYFFMEMSYLLDPELSGDLWTCTEI